jgi:tetratricopeptide (TPR) repeat protein
VRPASHAPSPGLSAAGGEADLRRTSQKQSQIDRELESIHRVMENEVPSGKTPLPKRCLTPSPYSSHALCLCVFLALLVLFLVVTTSLAQGSAQKPTANLPEDGVARADALLGQGKLDEAITLLSELMQKEPKLPGLEGKLGKAYYKKRNFQQAISHFKVALQQSPEDGELAQLLGLSYYASGQLEQAIPLLEKVQSVLPSSEIDGSYFLGVCYLKTQQLEKARAAFARMFSVPAESPMAHLMLAKMMVRQQIEDKAVPELQKAIALDPRLPMVHFLLGEIYLYKSNPQLALEEFKKELELNPTVWLVYWRLGDAYARLEKYGDAERVLKQAIWLNETFTGPYVLLGQIGLKKGDLELAVGFLERALKLDPNNYYAHYSLGRAYQQLGRTSDANREFESTRALRADKKNSEDLLVPEAP